MSRSTKKLDNPNPNRAKYRIVFGAFLFFAGIASAMACLSFLMHWKADLSAVSDLGVATIEIENLVKGVGLYIGYFLVYKGFGISGIFLPILFSITGFVLFFGLTKRRLINLWTSGLFGMLWLTFFLYVVLEKGSVFAGIVGYEMGLMLEELTGMIGLLFILLFTAIAYAVIAFKWTPSLSSTSLSFPGLPFKNISVEWL